MKKTVIAKIFASKKVKTEKKGRFVTVSGWGKEDVPLKDGLNLLPVKAVAPRA